VTVLDEIPGARRRHYGIANAFLQACMRLVVFLSALGLLLTAAIAAAAPLPIRFDRFDQEAGLSQLTVNAIEQDAAGFLWIGTEEGLDQFDGYSFRHARHDRQDKASLSNNYISDIEADPDGGLWVATDGGGVVRRDPASGAFVPIDAQGLKRVRALRVDRSGTLWIGGRDGGVAAFDPRTRQLTSYRHVAGDGSSLPSDSVYALLEDRRGDLWVGTEEGLARFDAAKRRIVRERIAGADAVLVNALLEDSRGRIWIGTYRGVVRIDPATGERVSFRHAAANARSLPSDTIEALREDGDRRIWIGTAAGLALFDAKRGDFDVYRNDAADPHSLPDNHVISLHEDRGGVLWIGTKFGGLVRWNPRSWSFGHRLASPEEGFASRNAMAFAQDRAGRLWVGTFGGGITIVDRANGRASALRLSDDRVMALLTGRDGTVWAGTMQGGLHRIDPELHTVKAFRHDPSDSRSLSAPGVMSLLEDSRGRLWIGTYGGGLSRLERESETFVRHLDGDRVTALAEDPSGRLWVGTDGGGLSVLDPSNGKVFRFRHDAEDPRTLSADTVYALHVDHRGSVWVGTRSGGLDRVIGSASEPQSIRFQNIAERDGLPNGTVYGIRPEARTALWLSTNYGLARLDLATRKVRSFHRRDGLQGEEFNFGSHYASPGGEIFFGGANGYNAFHPAQLRFNRSPPQVALTSVSGLEGGPLSGAAAHRARLLHLDHRHNTLTFEFAALDYAAPGANTFRYKLENLERNWVDAGVRRTITYTNLREGHYVLRVQAANPDGTWNQRGLSIALDVEPPPWRTGWAYSLMALLVLALIVAAWAAHRRTLAREARYSRELETQVRDRTREIATHADALERANRQLEEMTLTDPLTGLGNRRSLSYSMKRILDGCSRGGRQPRVAMIAVDLDCMKPVNDEFGHDAGDRVLKRVAEILRGCVPASDAVVRWGGDEFLVLHACEDLDAAAELAERMRAAVSKNRYAIGRTAAARTSCSLGFALYPFVRTAPGLVTWEDVIRLADAALYRAKSRRNAWVGWNGVAAAPHLVNRIVGDPDTAEQDGFLETRVSEATTGETIELFLRRPADMRGR
jgi:diguanylate cyclase (GGDEF)-like protein